jgi:hypothetical protein
MPYRPRYDKGDWKAICDSCGRELKASELRKRWDGFMVCAGDWEPRQPQDFVRGVADFQAPPFTRPEPADIFIPFNFNTVASDSVSLTESNAKVIYKNITSALNNSSVNAQALNELAINNNSVTTDYPNESLSFTESIFVAVGRQLSDSLSVTESIAKQVKPVLTDSFSLSETVVMTPTKRPSDSVSFSESLVFNGSKVLTDSVSISESTTFYIESPTVLNGAGINLLSIG